MAEYRIRIGAPGTLVPPMDNLLKNAQRNEAQGFDSLWWPDHIMGWYPQSIWSPDVAEIAGTQKNSDTYFDAMISIAAAATATKSVKLGTAVTEPFRHHPAVLAQTFLTLDHLSKGRVVLGIGAGEAENIVPYGLDHSRPAARLEEALRIIRLLWESEGPVSYEGKFWHLDRAVLGLDPYGGKCPPIWVAAHGPKMLEMTGKYADGWMPTRLQVAEYGQKLNTIKQTALAAGRDLSQFTPSMYTYLVMDKDHDVCHRIVNEPLIKHYCLLLPPETFAQFGYKHPLGDTYGLRDYIPSHFSKEEALEAINKIPSAIAEHYIMHGTPEDVAQELQEFGKVGLQHIVLWNITFFGDMSTVRSSFECMNEVVRLVS